MTEFAIQLGVRFLVFGLVLIVMLRRREDIRIKPKWAVPVMALAIALFNALLYPLVAPILKLASLGFGFLVVPLGLNGGLLYLMSKKLKFLELKGFGPLWWLTLAITGAHAALYVAFHLIF